MFLTQNSKAKHLVEMSKMLVEKFDGEVPSDPNALVTSAWSRA